MVVSLAIGAIAVACSAASPREDPQHLHRRPGWRREIALPPPCWGAFAVAISRSGITDLLAPGVISQLGKDASRSRILWVKSLLITLLLAVSHLLPEPDPRCTSPSFPS